jgi:hypothetical protein
VLGPVHRATAVLVALAACGGSPDDTVDAGPLLDAGDGDFQIARVGFVNLIEDGFLGTYALLQDRPELPLAAAIAQEAECTVFRRPPASLCDPPCTDGVCTAPDVCTPYAQHASAGPITVTGLRAPLTFEPGTFGYTPTPAPPEDLFAPGATLTISAPGDVTPAFSTTVTAPAPLEAPFQNLTLVDGVDTTVTWTAGDGGPRSIQLMLVVGWHGAPPEALLVCETADDGAHTLPGSLISQLPRASSGLEQHNSWILRFDRSIVAAPAGPIEIVAGSQANLYFSHP